jgi:hypothetical protein
MPTNCGRTFARKIFAQSERPIISSPSRPRANPGHRANRLSLRIPLRPRVARQSQLRWRSERSDRARQRPVGAAQPMRWRPRLDGVALPFGRHVNYLGIRTHTVCDVLKRSGRYARSISICRLLLNSRMCPTGIPMGLRIATKSVSLSGPVKS